MPRLGRLQAVAILIIDRRTKPIFELGRESDKSSQ